MKKNDIVKSILGSRLDHSPLDSTVYAFAPTNIALCKYWGKRDAELNLPVTNSLSISLGNKGATTVIRMIDALQDRIFLNDVEINLDTFFAKRLIDFLNLFRSHHFFEIKIHTNVPIAAGLASSACGFASIVKALDELYQWDLPLSMLSVLARLGSGSAARSVWDGFVEWHAGIRPDGMDSYGEQLDVQWPEFRVGLLLVSQKEKSISSRDAMQRTMDTSPAYRSWPKKVSEDLQKIKQGLRSKDFKLVGKASESNALMMHALMLTAQPPIQYSTPETLLLMQRIWKLREDGLSIYFTQDAGPNLKLLFLDKDFHIVREHFPGIR